MLSVIEDDIRSYFLPANATSKTTCQKHGICSANSGTGNTDTITQISHNKDMLAVFTCRATRLTYLESIVKQEVGKKSPL